MYYILRESNTRADLLSKLASTKKVRHLKTIIQETLQTSTIDVEEIMAGEEEKPNWMTLFKNFLIQGCRNLPFGGRATRGSQVRLPRKKNARSRHQRLFEENVGKTEKVWSTNFKCERFGSCIYARGRY